MLFSAPPTRKRQKSPAQTSFAQILTPSLPPAPYLPHLPMPHAPFSIADPRKQIPFRRVAENKLGDEVFATAAICDGQIFARVARRNGDSSEEALYGIGFPSDRPAVDPTLEK